MEKQYHIQDDKHVSKVKQRKTTVFLSAIFIFLVLLLLSIIFVMPAYEKFYYTRIKYPVYGGMTEELKDSELFIDMKSGKSFCFLGDSITNGSETNGISWYQPLIPYIKGSISELSCGGWRVSDLINEKDNIPNADIYVIAIGINDSVWNKYSVSARTPEEYAERIGQLTEIIRTLSPDAKIYYIAPWIFFNQGEDAPQRVEQYRKALENRCEKNGCVYINPVPVLTDVLNKTDVSKYMKDDVHPNTPDGVGLYSYAVLKADHERKAAK